MQRIQQLFSFNSQEPLIFTQLDFWLFFILVMVIWIASSVFYTYDYSLGLSLLFFLSFSHVLLEFPLNIVSIVGIGTESLSIFKNGFKKPINS